MLKTIIKFDKKQMNLLTENYTTFLVNNKNYITAKKMHYNSIQEEEQLIQLEKLYYMELEEEEESVNNDNNM